MPNHTEEQSGTASARYAPLTKILPRFTAEGAISAFLVMAVIVLLAGSEATRLGRLILLGGAASLGAVAGAVFALLWWFTGRMDYKKSGGAMTPPEDE